MVWNSELKRDLIELSHRLEMIQTVLVVSNPDSPMAAEAYDGLRKTVIGSLKATQVLEAALAQLDQISRATDDMEAIRTKLRELMGVAGVVLVEDYDKYREAFDIVGTGSVPIVVKPAYLAAERGAIAARGVVELTDQPTGNMQENSPTSQPGGDAFQTQRNADLASDDGTSPAAIDGSPPPASQIDVTRPGTDDDSKGEQK